MKKGVYHDMQTGMRSFNPPWTLARTLSRPQVEMCWPTGCQPAVTHQQVLFAHHTRVPGMERYAVLGSV
jgi:hypothetical protein